MSASRDLRRSHLIAVCRALAAYLERDHEARLRTVTDDESAAELVKELQGQSAVVFTIENWEAFRKILEPEGGGATSE